VLLDFHPYLDQPVNARLLKEIALDYEKIARTLVLVGLEVSCRPISTSSRCAFTSRCPATTS
jgi:hypothetical protein